MKRDLKIELEEYGFATVDYPKGVTEIVRKAMDSWQKFCALPLETKSKFLYGGEGRTGGITGTGYEYKNTLGKGRDLKENFHFILDDMKRFFDIAKENNVDPSFIQTSEVLLEALIDPVCQFAKQFESEFDVPGFAGELYDSRGSWILRCLHYFPGSKAGEPIASHHCDKAGLTMYLSETTKGVEYYHKDQKWISMPILPGKTIITPNMQVQLKTNNEVKALYHRVVANDISAKEGRYSIVCFADFLHTPRYWKEKFGALQNMPIAFNYEMPFEEFTKFFI